MTCVAFLSPLPPSTSGIADYSAELLPALAPHCKIDLFTSDPQRTSKALTQRFRVRPVEEFMAVDRRRPYDGVLYQIGNSRAHHGAIYRAALERPGIVVLHEYVLHHLVRESALEQGGRAAFSEEMRYCYGRTGLSMAGRLLHANNLPEMWTYPLFEHVVDTAQGIIVHSRTTRDRVLASRPEALVTVVPHHLSLYSTTQRSRKVKRRLLSAVGLPDDAFVVATFGHLTTAKGLHVALRAFAGFKQTHPDAVYLLVGEVSHAYPELTDLLNGELGNGVLTTGRVALETLLEFMANCDVAVNLRDPTGGETSGACLRLLGLGRPVIVTDSGWFSEIPDDCCAKVGVGRDQEALLAALLEVLADDVPLRRRMGANAARWAAGRHRLEDSARLYAQFIKRIAAEVPVPARAVPPLASFPPTDLVSALIAEIAGGLGDLGFTERDRQFERIVATTLVELDLDTTTRRAAFSGGNGMRGQRFA